MSPIVLIRLPQSPSMCHYQPFTFISFGRLFPNTLNSAHSFFTYSHSPDSFLTYSSSRSSHLLCTSAWICSLGRACVSSNSSSHLVLPEYFPFPRLDFDFAPFFLFTFKKGPFFYPRPGSLELRLVGSLWTTLFIPAWFGFWFSCVTTFRNTYITGPVELSIIFLLLLLPSRWLPNDLWSLAM